MRVVRVTEILRKSERFEASHHMIETIIKTFKDMPSVATLISLFVLLMALVGRSLLDAGSVLRRRWPAPLQLTHACCLHFELICAREAHRRF